MFISEQEHILINNNICIQSGVKTRLLDSQMLYISQWCIDLNTREVLRAVTIRLTRLTLR